MRHPFRVRSFAGPTASPRAALYALCVSFFMICLDATVVNVAVPDIRTSLGASLNDVVWVNSAYALCYAVPLILAGRLGDRYGPKRVFLVGVAGFTAASLACALAPGAEVLIAARAVQGLAAALVAPQTMTLIVHLFPADRRGAALGAWGAVGGAAMAAGPVIGGLLVAWTGWRGIFLVNLPVGVAGWIAAYRLLPDRRPAARHRMDPWGIALSGLGLTALVFGVQSGEAYDWGTVAGPVTIPGILVLGVLCLVAFVWWQHHNPDEPLLPPRLFHHRDFSAAAAAGGAMGAAMGGLFLPLMIYLQSDLGYSPLAAGAATVPMFALSSLCARLAGKRSDTAGPRLLAALGFALLIVGTGSLTLLLGPGIGLWVLMPSLLVSGIGIGLVSAPLAGIATRSLEPSLVGAASGVFNTTRQLGGALGSAATGVLLQAGLGDTPTTATQAALAFPVLMLVVGLACCAAVRPTPPVRPV
ncbi:DHA2 family efflux MFS transporter permease subunit [Streptomyces sp. NPDC057939]|uniref:DHA2 family efflux MFS transporter permease subunit n=1 Tax=Streptomyces sp. NPDC057939 TaxID=3346284 RepID=UPI0036E9F60E